MTETINYADFSVFADMYNDTVEKWNIHNDSADIWDTQDTTDYDDALKDYYDAYCSYLVSRKYDTETIKAYRKNAIIDFYITENKIANSLRKDLDEYYTKNIIDTFNKKLDPPPCFFHQVKKAQKCEEAREKREIDTDDVAQHYINLKNMYKNVYEEMMNPHSLHSHRHHNDLHSQHHQHHQHSHRHHNDLHQHSLHSHQHSHQHSHLHQHNPNHVSYEDNESNSDKYADYYDEYYNMYGSDYYTDHECNSDECVDDYDLHDN
jgi:hypothetical protein